jgi:hypothetical protein
MIVFLAGLIVFLLAALAMAVGVLFGRPGIKGHGSGQVGKERETCIRDEKGRKISPCSHCDCQ